MRRFLLTSGAISLIYTGAAFADPAAMVGVSWALGPDSGKSNFGITAKLLSSDEQDEFVAAAGVTFYPFSSKQLGFDVGAGYNFSNASAVLSYDFTQQAPQFSVGWADTHDDSSPSSPPPPMAPPPPP